MKTLDRLRVLTRLHDLRDRPDADLVRLFADRGDEAAFELLVRRHGPLVLGVCRRALGDHAAADDAFQATFLLLARRAPTLREPAGLSRWLYGTAGRVAREAQRQERRRRRRERRAARPEGVHSPPDDTTALVDTAVRRLPEPYRSAVLLCDLGGHTRERAAAELGVPAGTVASRVSRGRELLAAALARQGVALGVLAVPVSVGLCESTARVAGLVAAGEAAPAAVVTLLTNGGRAMFVLKAAAVGLVLSGAAVVLAPNGGQQPALPAKPIEAKPAPVPPPKPAETPRQKLDRLKKEYKSEHESSTKIVGKTPTGQPQYVAGGFDLTRYTKEAGELMAVADADVAFDAFVFKLDLKGDDPAGRAATVAAFLDRFARTARAPEMVMPLLNSGENREQLLTRFAERTTDRAAAAWSLLALANNFDTGSGCRPADERQAMRVVEGRAKAVPLYRRIVAEYPTETVQQGQSLADAARRSLGRIEHASPGRPAPKTVGVDLDGKPLDLADFKGRVVVLYFWQPLGQGSTRFGIEEKELTGLLDRHPGEPLTVLGVTGGYGREPDRYKDEAAKFGHTWRSWFDPYPAGTDGKPTHSGPRPIHDAWYVNSWPHIVVVGPDGVIESNVYQAGQNVEVAERLLAKLANPKPDKQ